MPIINLDTAIRRYQEIAKPELMRWFVPNSCIAAIRITIDVFCALGFKVRSQPVYYQLHDEEKNQIHICGKRFIKDFELINTLTVVDDLRVTNDWDGHLVAIIEDQWFIDPTWDGSLCSYDRTIQPDTPVAFPIGDRSFNTLGDGAELRLSHESGKQCSAKYVVIDDDGYTKLPAWEDDHTEIATVRLVRGILSDAPLSELIGLFVIYNDTVEIAPCKYIVRRFTLSNGTVDADSKIWATANDDACLNSIRKGMLDSGMVRLQKFKIPDAKILEMWV